MAIQLRLYGMWRERSMHACRTELYAYEVLVGETERKRTLRKPKCKLERTSMCGI